MTVQSDEAGLRLDKWLWAARFFKTRSAAITAINGGKVHVNGKRVKPARAVRPGDRLEIRRAHEQLTVVVAGINAQRRPAPEAQMLYTETPESQLARQQASAERRALKVDTPHPFGRPNKRERRQIRRLTGKD